MQPETISPPARRLGLSLAFASAATAVAMALMFWSRDAFQIRTLPERVLEWVQLFVPPATLEAGIGRFGFQAKVYALYAAVIGMALILLAVGALLLTFARSPWAIWAAGPVLYLAAMGAIMPITGGGPFGSELFQGPWLVNACYLGIAVAYASVLLLGHRRGGGRGVGRPARPSPHTPHPSTRRAFLATFGPGLAAFLAVLWFGRRGGGSDLPLARLEGTPRPAASASPPIAAASPSLPPAVAVAQPTPPPAVAAPAPGAAATAAPAPPTPQPTSPPTPEPTPAAPLPPTPEPALPVPQPMDKPIARDEYGATTAGARQPGTLSPLITPMEDHYHVTKNPVSDPVVKPESWRLVLDGELQRPVQLDYRTLRQLPAIEIVKTLECISNFTAECQLVPFGCELIGTAIWKGVPLKDLIDLAGGFKPGVVSVSLVGEDEFTSAIPAEVALDAGTVLAYEMNGEVLPYEHGYPARLLTPGRYGYKSPKWVRGVRPTAREVPDWYAQRNWSKDGIVKTMSRIDVPAPGAALPPGPQRIAGIAYAADRGISKVEFSADGGGSWQTASFLEPPPGKDAWVRWEGSFELPPGATARLFARATDGAGQLQTQEFVLPAPNGASGWNSIEVRASITGSGAPPALARGAIPQ